MGGHAAPASWLERWQAAEPVRLYLWGVAAAVLSAGLVAGWLTQELYVALTAVAASVLTFGGTAAARRHAYAPDTVERLLEAERIQGQLLADDAVQRVLRHARPRSPEDVARELGRYPEEEETSAMPAVSRDTVALERVRSCPYMDEDGRRCTLAEHPRKIDHRLETAGR